MEILFINACVRGKETSRTYAAARAFLDSITKADASVRITEKNLSEIHPPYMDEALCAKREALIEKKDFANPMFDLAREFADADRIVIAAPMWEFEFPAILKAYIENVSVAGITFCYTDMGSLGLCKAEKMAFITTRGSDYSIPPLSNMEFGASYLRALCNMYGIKSFECICANGLDTEGTDAKKETEALKKRCTNKGPEFIK